MNIEKRETKTYVLSGLERIDPVTVYVHNYAPGDGKIVIECFGDAWAYRWGSMGDNTLQSFFVSCNNDYILRKLLKTISQTDFDAINEKAKAKGIDLCVTTDVEVAMQSEAMAECFGPDWYMDLPTCSTYEYEYLDRIVTAIKAAFNVELVQAA